MIVRVRLFALLRQIAGTDSLELELTDSATVGQLKARLAEEHPDLAPSVERSMIAIDEEYAQDDQVIPPGVDVACIPPVSGGGAWRRLA